MLVKPRSAEGEATQTSNKETTKNKTQAQAAVLKGGRTVQCSPVECSQKTHSPTHHPNGTRARAQQQQERQSNGSQSTLPGCTRVHSHSHCWEQLNRPRNTNMFARPPANQPAAGAAHANAGCESVRHLNSSMQVQPQAHKQKARAIAAHAACPSDRSHWHKLPRGDARESAAGQVEWGNGPHKDPHVPWVVQCTGNNSGSMGPQMPAVRCHTCTIPSDNRRTTALLQLPT